MRSYGRKRSKERMPSEKGALIIITCPAVCVYQLIEVGRGGGGAVGHVSVMYIGKLKGTVYSAQPLENCFKTEDFGTAAL
jgi:hypothetical protein